MLMPMAVYGELTPLQSRRRRTHGAPKHGIHFPFEVMADLAGLLFIGFELRDKVRATSFGLLRFRSLFRLVGFPSWPSAHVG